jgi:ABC-2 type transport system permease protein
MKLLNIIIKEIKVNFKGFFIYTLLMSLFFMWFTTMFDAEFLGDMEELLEGYPEAIRRIVGEFISLTTFTGFISVYLFSLTWLYLGIYFIMKVSQDIPKEIEDKTIDIILSKPIRRWKFVIGKFSRYVLSALFLVLCLILGVFIGIYSFPNIDPSIVYIPELIFSFFWLFIFLIALISTGLLFSTFLTPRRALSFAFGLIIFFYIIGTYWENFGENMEFLKYFSIFSYFETSNLLVNQVWTNVLGNILILTGYSISVLAISIIIFNKRDIPV